MMSKRAQELGMKNSEFHSAHGLPPATGQKPDLMSATDLATLGRKLAEFPEVMEWAGASEAPFRDGSFTMRNTNHLVRTYKGATGLKSLRIAATKVLRVTLHIGPVTNPLARAETIINRYEAGGIRAEVTLRFAEDYLELLAHEFEHIIEQIDGVSLRDEAFQGRGERRAPRTRRGRGKAPGRTRRHEGAGRRRDHRHGRQGSEPHRRAAPHAIEKSHWWSGWF